jgi:hypothetical protein
VATDRWRVARPQAPRQAASRRVAPDAGGATAGGATAPQRSRSASSPRARTNDGGSSRSSVGRLALATTGSSTRCAALISSASKLPGLTRNATRTGQPAAVFGRIRTLPAPLAAVRSMISVLRRKYCGNALTGPPASGDSNTISSTASGTGTGLAANGQRSCGISRLLQPASAVARPSATSSVPLRAPARDHLLIDCRFTVTLPPAFLRTIAAASVRESTP